IVLSQADGRLVKMGVIESSGSTAFDVSVLESTRRGSPFGSAPPAIASSDSNVYVHWQFHRNPLLACSTYFARPYIIRVPAHNAPTPLPAAAAPVVRKERADPTLISTEAFATLALSPDPTQYKVEFTMGAPTNEDVGLCFLVGEETGEVFI